MNLFKETAFRAGIFCVLLGVIIGLIVGLAVG